jgi:hypothetical protein
MSRFHCALPSMASMSSRQMSIGVDMLMGVRGAWGVVMLVAGGGGGQVRIPRQNERAAGVEVYRIPVVAGQAQAEFAASAAEAVA